MAPVNFFWFGRGTAWALTKQFVGAFLTRRFVRLEVHPYDKDGTPALKLYVITTGTATNRAAATPLNESVPWPPICPGGGGG